MKHSIEDYHFAILRQSLVLNLSDDFLQAKGLCEYYRVDRYVCVVIVRLITVICSTYHHLGRCHSAQRPRR